MKRFITTNARSLTANPHVYPKTLQGARYWPLILLLTSVVGAGSLAEPLVAQAADSPDGLSSSPGPGPGVSSPPHSPSALGAGPKEKASRTVTTEYLIGPEDVLEITVWRNQDLSKEVVVRPDGRISLPLIGEVMAVGRTPAELTQVISSKLKEFKENPSVAITVREVNSYNIFVLGEVGKPGKYPLKSKTTLLQGITMAGGFTQVAARNKIVVFRFNENGGKDAKFVMSYDDIVLRDGGREQNIELKPGDTIVVPSETIVVMP